MASDKIIINVEGMSCGHCSAMVQRTLEAINGISEVAVDLDGKKASFNAGDNALVDEAIKEVSEAGYKASRT